MEDAVSDRLLGASAATRRIVERIEALLTPSDGNADRFTGLSFRTASRTARRDFATAVGVSPKQYTRIARFRRAAALVERGDVRLSMIALDLGYFDQAHLSADFREFAGLSATRFRRDDERDRLAASCSDVRSDARG